MALLFRRCAEQAHHRNSNARSATRFDGGQTWPNCRTILSFWGIIERSSPTSATSNAYRAESNRRPPKKARVRSPERHHRRRSKAPLFSSHEARSNKPLSCVQRWTTEKLESRDVPVLTIQHRPF